jgi:hypothetical protein
VRRCTATCQKSLGRRFRMSRLCCGRSFLIPLALYVIVFGLVVAKRTQITQFFFRMWTCPLIAPSQAP